MKLLCEYTKCWFSVRLLCFLSWECYCSGLWCCEGNLNGGGSLCCSWVSRRCGAIWAPTVEPTSQAKGPQCLLSSAAVSTALSLSLYRFFSRIAFMFLCISRIIVHMWHLHACSSFHKGDILVRFRVRSPTTQMCFNLQWFCLLVSNIEFKMVLKLE